jgi:filamentous hemagglutinin
VYESNQMRARDANLAVDQFHQQVGWGQREVTVTTSVDGQPSSRRLDIGDVEGLRAIEYKTGYQSATPDNLWEVQRDADLVRRGWEVEWVFKGEASQPLLDALNRAGIKYRKDGG